MIGINGGRGCAARKVWPWPGGADATGAAFIAHALDNAQIYKVSPGFVGTDGGKHFVQQIRDRILADGWRNKWLPSVVLCLVNKVRASVLLQFVVLPGVHSLSSPIVGGSYGGF